MLLALVAPALSGVLVNEVLYDPTGSDDGFEWVELCNNGATVDLAGYTIEAGGSSWGVCYEIAGGDIANGEYVVIGYGSATDPGSFDPNLQNGGSDADGVRLVDPDGNVVDTVLYDEPDNNGLGDDNGTATSFAPDAGEAKSIGRAPDCVDTDASGDDFVVFDAPTPGAENGSDTGTTDTGPTDTGTTDPGDADCSGSDSVTINEFSPLTDVEFAEIYTAAAVDLSGWVFEYGTSDWTNQVVIPAGTVLAAGERFTIGSPGASCKDLEQDMDLGNAGTSADAIRLTCGGNAVDTVVYAAEGKPNSDEWVDDSGDIATSLALVPSADHSMGRAPDGADSDQSGADFFEQEITACAPNPEPPVCNAGVDSIKLNEVLYDPEGSDTDYEWVEIVNTGSEDVALDGWAVQTATSEFKDDALLPAGTIIPAGGFLLVGGPNVAEVDVAADGFSLGNGTEGDGVRLVDCVGTPMDTLLYGDPMADGLTDDAGGSDVVAGVDSNVSLGRYPDGADTDTIDDWHAFVAPTPGESNGDPAGDGSKTEGPTGCGGDRPGTDRPGGCATAPVMGGWLLAAIAAARRRRV
jgi:hypothetical protein